MIVAALGRAAVEPGGLPLHGVVPASLFPTSTSAKKTAQFCKTEGFLHVLRTEARGRGVREICAITEKGLAYLLTQASPNQVFGDLVRALHDQQGQIGELLKTVRQWQANNDSFKSLVDKCLHQGDRNGHLRSAPAVNGETVNPATSECKSLELEAQILSFLDKWQEAGDCPLPELHRRIGGGHITIGQFHDELRRLHQEERIYLHPWTGPLPEIPEPALALLAGHGIAYYASRRFPCP
jgi:hypothetical protein